MYGPLSEPPYGVPPTHQSSIDWGTHMHQAVCNSGGGIHGAWSSLVTWSYILTGEANSEHINPHMRLLQRAISPMNKRKQWFGESHGV